MKTIDIVIVISLLSFVIHVIWSIIVYYRFLKKRVFFSKLVRYFVVSILIAIICIVSVYWKLYAPVYLFTKVSPSGEYKLRIYEVPMIFAMPGSGGDNLAVIELLDKNNNMIGKLGGIGGESSCGVMVRNVEVSWIDEFAFYARGNAFNLKTGKACED